jgi:TolA-binding protein
MARKELEDAAAHFSATLQQDPKGPFAEQASLLLAQCLERNHASEQAIRQYRRIVDGSGARFTPDALFSLALLLYRDGELADAARQLDRLLKEFPDHALAGPSRLLRGRVSFDQERYDEAFSSFEKAAADENAEDSAVAEAQYWMAKCELRAGKAREAAARLRRVIEGHAESPLLPQARYDVGVALVRAGDDDRAVEALATFLAKHADHELAPDALLLDATIEHRQRRFDRSAEHCRAFLRAYAEHEAARQAAFLLAENLFLMDETEEAVTAYREFITRFPGDPELGKAKLRLGTALHRLARLDDARNVLVDVEKAARHEATFRPALLMLGDISFQRGEWKQAEDYLSTYLTDGFDQPAADGALLKLGLSLQRQSRPEEAVQMYDRLLERFDQGPLRLQAVFERGQALVMLERPDEAAAAFQALLEADPQSRLAPFALNHLAAIASKHGRFDDAAKLYDRVAAADSGGAMTAEALFLRAENLMGARQFAKAESAFQAFLDRHGSDPKAVIARTQLAIALARQDRCKDAVEAFERCEGQSASLQPSLRASAIYEKAWCLRELGETTQAAQAYRKLIAEDLPGPLTMHALLELAGIDQEAGRFDPASQLFKRLRELLGQNTGDVPAGVAEQATYRLAVCEFEQGQFEPAAEHFEEFVERFAESAQAASASYYAGEALFKLGRFERAIEHLKRVAERHQVDAVYAPALLRLGESLAKVQRFGPSENAFAEYLERFADREHWYQAQFGIGWAREHQKRYEEAIDAYKRLVGKHAGPTAARAQFQIGECLFAMKRHEDAARELLKVDILYAYPQWSAAALFEAGRCFEEMNQTALARDNFKKVAGEHPDSQWGRMAAQRLAALSSSQVPGQ